MSTNGQAAGTAEAALQRSRERLERLTALLGDGDGAPVDLTAVARRSAPADETLRQLYFFGGVRPVEGPAADAATNDPVEGPEVDEWLGESHAADAATDVPVEEPEVGEWRQAAAAGDGKAMFLLGFCYANGRNGVGRDETQAIAWWRQGAEAGNARAMWHLGGCYYLGEGVDRDYGMALKWFGKAADVGDCDALASLCHMHQHGHGTPRNLGKALVYCKQAAARGAPLIHIPSPFAEIWGYDFECAPSEVASRLETSISADPKQVSQLVEEVVDIQLRNADLQAERLAKEASIAAAVKAKQSAATLAQTDTLANRRNGKAYPVAREAVVAAWTPTAVDLADCPACVRRISVGDSVLLSECLHGVCASCAPHMVKSDGTIKCPVCETTSPESVAALQRHPVIEAELGAGTVHACDACKVAPIDEDGAETASFRCTSCEPARLLCEGHSVTHRTKKPSHVLSPLPNGGAALRCPTHDQPIAAYCSSCRMLVCLACLTSTHHPSTHATHLLTDRAFVETARTRLREAAAVARTVADALIDHATDATVAGTEVDARDTAITNEVDRAFKVLLGLLERRREAAHSQHATHSREERKTLQRIREESEYRWRIITSAADLAEKLANGTHLGVNAAAVLAQLEAAAMVRLNAVVQMAPSTRVPTAAVLRLDLDDAIGGQLETLGQIVEDAPFRAT